MRCEICDDTLLPPGESWRPRLVWVHGVEGRLVQQGTHDALLASGGLYADLYRILVRTELERA